MKQDREIRAIPTLVLEGDKQDITALFIHIKKANKEEKEKLLEVVAKKVYLRKAVLGQSEPGSILALFNLPTKQYRHELEALKVAEEIKKETKDFKSLIMGIGLHTGRAIISPVRNDIVHYTCLGDAVDLAKRLAVKSDEVALSKAIYDKIGGQIKAKLSEKLSQSFGMPIYTLVKISEREKYEPYIKEFVEKLKEEEAKQKKSK